MIVFNLPEIKDVVWYAWVIAGFIIGAYLHSAHTRHAIHWTIIKVLQGFIWFLHRSDPFYEEPKTMTKPDKITPIITKKQSPNDPEKQLADLLSNPDISIRKIQ